MHNPGWGGMGVPRQSGKPSMSVSFPLPMLAIKWIKETAGLTKIRQGRLSLPPLREEEKRPWERGWQNLKLYRVKQTKHLIIARNCFTRLQRLEEEIISKRVKLVILDSVASLVRKEFDSRLFRNLNERTALLSKEAAILK